MIEPALKCNVIYNKQANQKRMYTNGISTENI